MNSVILGVGATTPAGATAAETWRLLTEGYCAPRVPVPQPLSERKYLYCAVPEKFVRTVGRQARLRRSGALSLFGASAAFDALSDARVEVTPEFGARCALIYGVSSGSVQYTRRFYHDIVTQGASSASPLLFPETVFNAPASHLAALLGLNGKTYTVVGDSAVGLSAIHLGDEILALDPGVEHVLVVGTEEVDWLLPDAFAAWRLASTDGRCEVYGARTGLVFGEGAGAVLLARQGQGPVIARAHPGQSFFSHQDSRRIAPEVFHGVLGAERPDAIITSANGTVADLVEPVALLPERFRHLVFRHEGLVLVGEPGRRVLVQAGGDQRAQLGRQAVEVRLVEHDPVQQGGRDAATERRVGHASRNLTDIARLRPGCR